MKNASATCLKANTRNLLGVDKPTFWKMYTILLGAYNKLHMQGGRSPILTTQDKLIITLGYWREYRTYRNIAFDYGVGKTAIGDSIIWVEDTLINDGTFSLREIQRTDNVVCVVIVDVTEQEIERSQKNNASGILARKSVIQQKHS